MTDIATARAAARLLTAHLDGDPASRAAELTTANLRRTVAIGYAGREVVTNGCRTSPVSRKTFTVQRQVFKPDGPQKGSKDSTAWVPVYETVLLGGLCGAVASVLVSSWG